MSRERWDEGVLGMQVGEVAPLRCSPDYAYGPSGFPAWGIQPNSVLVFEIEVLNAKSTEGGGGGGGGGSGGGGGGVVWLSETERRGGVLRRLFAGRTEGGKDGGGGGDGVGSGGVVWLPKTEGGGGGWS
ncbi:Peptidyl-prolyl cis-trans isomerase FKBP12 [Camellia lanceoleosa]|uniref:Peptidyl-prolyl cis-trans isomerase FKBP12 n=1 Tax=Camellia lanceoleosa TaxID=1840588 RepID=A0ACC0FVR7_9ERIC|nr:Peptidyl-prolyl cis-trans isomerase FKBP12 [Camellia lanceoleosa]